MEKNFKDPIKATPVKKQVKNPWNFEAPPYDERTSCYVDAGTHYGVGHRSPVGHHGEAKARVATMPFGRQKTMETDEVPRKIRPIEIIE